MNASLKLFAIKHTITGHYLPCPIGRGGRGGSHVEPAPATEAYPPRLFHQKSAAKIALTHWLKGKITVTYDNDEEEHWHLDLVPSRKREEMEIVSIEMRLS
jgi:hypothetical protein